MSVSRGFHRVTYNSWGIARRFTCISSKFRFFIQIPEHLYNVMTHIVHGDGRLYDISGFRKDINASRNKMCLRLYCDYK